MRDAHGVDRGCPFRLENADYAGRDRRACVSVLAVLSGFLEELASSAG